MLGPHSSRCPASSAGPGGGRSLLLPQWGGECPGLPGCRGAPSQPYLEGVVGSGVWRWWGRPGPPGLGLSSRSLGLPHGSPRVTCRPC